MFDHHKIIAGRLKIILSISLLYFSITSRLCLMFIEASLAARLVQ